ncbi:MAG: winged helix-turn-helix domain-containing protein [Nanoarchaeota archaeon]|nr:winged helix-turn-helix domain-containing protein [Nanoarchaeota archaeon]
MGKRRDKLDIISDILKSIQDKGGRIKPTHLLYKSNLSHEGMKRYIDELKTKLMIIEEEDMKKKSKQFLITDKGLQFLQDYRKIREFTNSFGF